MEEFLKIAGKHKIGVMFVLFDSVWDPNPYWGRQREPRPASAQLRLGPGPRRRDSQDPQRFEKLKGYVQGVIRKFAKDPRIHAWDLWNEPDNINGNSYRA